MIFSFCLLFQEGHTKNFKNIQSCIKYVKFFYVTVAQDLIRNISRQLDDVNEMCMTRNCVEQLIEVYKTSENLLSKLAQEKLKLGVPHVENKNFEMVTLEQNCVSVHKCNANFSLSQYRLYSRPIYFEESLRYLHVASQLMILSKGANQLIPNHINTGRYGDVYYVTTASVIPQLSVTGYVENLQSDTTASFIWNGSYSDIVAEQLVPFMNNPGGDYVIIKGVSFLCEFVDTTRNKFSDSGCFRRDSNPYGPIHCECNHTTVFAILLSIHATVIPSGVKVSSSSMILNLCSRNTFGICNREL